ncbi:hypothetical protein [Geomicrobium sediminis]|uniref:Transporter n=1 Tax=Geomicrobium sediminis TaxID=1347788 RepID=A0ABS2P6Z6_9BACL|nr:hypothetical protein [Geomicrobium sediminis]MBM7631174.1 hypothetical protein [Geomicrobium sediminis]
MSNSRIISIPFPGGGGFFPPGPPGPPPGPPWQPPGPPWQPPGPPGPRGGPPPNQGAQPPSAPPPNFIPMQSQATPFVDSGAISFCQFRFTYIWLRNGQSFWYYPIFVGQRSVAGFRWNGRNWVFFGINTNQITSFSCQ